MKTYNKAPGVVTFQSYSKTTKWGKANPMRGRNHIDIAKTFVIDFPVGTKLTTKQFDRWLHDQDLLDLPPKALRNNPDVWMADAWHGHIYRRNKLRKRINASANHPRMTDEGSCPFIIMFKKGMLEVLAPQTAANQPEMPKKFKTLVKTKREQLKHLLQSADWVALPPYERIYAEMLYDGINDFVAHSNFLTDQLNNKFSELTRRLEVMIRQGSITPKDGLHQLINNQNNEEDTDENEEYEGEDDDRVTEIA